VHFGGIFTGRWQAGHSALLTLYELSLPISNRYIKLHHDNRMSMRCQQKSSAPRVGHPTLVSRDACTHNCRDGSATFASHGSTRNANGYAQGAAEKLRPVRVVSRRLGQPTPPHSCLFSDGQALRMTTHERGSSQLGPRPYHGAPGGADRLVRPEKQVQHAMV